MVRRLSVFIVCIAFAFGVFPSSVRSSADSVGPIASATSADVHGGSVSTAPAEDIEPDPHFVHIVSDECTLHCWAERLGLEPERLHAFNPRIADVDDIVPVDSELFIPIPFPLHPDMSPLKADVFEYRFVATYRSAVPFFKVNEIVEWYEEQLRAADYELIQSETKDAPGGGAVGFAGGWIARGTVEFSPGDEEHPTLIDIALVVDEAFVDDMDASAKE